MSEWGTTFLFPSFLLSAPKKKGKNKTKKKGGEADSTNASLDVGTTFFLHFKKKGGVFFLISKEVT